MNRTAKALTAALLALGIAVAGVPLTSNDGGASVAGGSSGCCRQ